LSIDAIKALELIVKIYVLFGDKIEFEN